MRFKLPGKKRLLFHSNCLKGLGFEFPTVYWQAFLQGIQAYAVTPLELLEEGNEEILITDYVRRPRIAEAVDYHVAMTMELMPEELDRSIPAHATCYCYWERKVELFRKHATKVIEFFQPDGVVCFQGYYLEAAILRELAAEHHVKCLAWEHSFFKTHLVWDDVTGVTIGSRLPNEFFQKYRGSQTPEAVLSYVDTVLAGLKRNKSLEHESPQSGCQSLDSEGKPIVLFLGQVYTDASVIFGRNTAGDPVSLIEALSDACDSLNYKLVVKLHPKENGGSNPIHQAYDQLTFRKMKESASLSESMQSGHVVCDAVNEFDTYALIRRAAVVVTLNSQAGLEAAVLNRPVVVCGNAFYSNNEFTVDLSSSVSLTDAIQSAFTGWNSERHFNACEYLDVFFNEYCVPYEENAIWQACREMSGLRL
jgi:capsule polysaccharide modification protein KpsS